MYMCDVKFPNHFIHNARLNVKKILISSRPWSISRISRIYRSISIFDSSEFTDFELITELPREQNFLSNVLGNGAAYLWEITIITVDS